VVAVFAASTGVPVELSFDGREDQRSGRVATAAGKTLVTGVQPGAGAR
jgi:hypothetical protein